MEHTKGPVPVGDQISEGLASTCRGGERARDPDTVQQEACGRRPVKHVQ